jgi:dihydroflavonol-4-reductase
MKILITGATGFVGSHMAYQAHLMGHEVILAKRSTSKMDLFHSVRKWYLHWGKLGDSSQLNELDVEFQKKVEFKHLEQDLYNPGLNGSMIALEGLNGHHGLDESNISLKDAKDNHRIDKSKLTAEEANVQNLDKSKYLTVKQVSQLKLRLGVPQLKSVLAFSGNLESLKFSVEDNTLPNLKEDTNSEFASEKTDSILGNYFKSIENFQPQWVEMDLLDTDDIFQVLDDSFDAVLHCAAIVSFDRKSEDKMIAENTEGTRNLVNTCLKTGVKKFLHISSIAALGRPENDQPIGIRSEWVESKYNTAYANSKYLAEMEVWRGKEEGLKVLILNPGVVLGFGEGHTSSEQVSNTVRKGIPAYPAGSNGFVFVDDLAHTALVMLQQETNFGERYLMVSHNLTFQFLMQELAQIMGVNPPRMELSGWKFQLSYWVIKIFEKLGFSMPISTELLMSTKRNSVYSDN